MFYQHFNNVFWVFAYLAKFKLKFINVAPSVMLNFLQWLAVLSVSLGISSLVQLLKTSFLYISRIILGHANKTHRSVEIQIFSSLFHNRKLAKVPIWAWKIIIIRLCFFVILNRATLYDMLSYCSTIISCMYATHLEKYQNCPNPKNSLIHL